MANPSFPPNIDTKHLSQLTYPDIFFGSMLMFMQCKCWFTMLELNKNHPASNLGNFYFSRLERFSRAELTGTWQQENSQPRLVHTILQTQEFWFTPWRVAETLLPMVYVLKRERIMPNLTNKNMLSKRKQKQHGGHTKFMWISITKFIWWKVKAEGLTLLRDPKP